MKTACKLLGIIFIGSSCLLIAAPPKQGKFILMTMLYNEKNKRRRQEYLTCLTRNLNHPDIEHIHILYDTSADDEKNILLGRLTALPVTITPIVGHATFGTFFTLAAHHYDNRAIIICNADIFFDETLSLLDSLDLSSLFIALTRWDIQKDRSTKPRGTSWNATTQQWVHKGNNGCGSQDAWIFQLPLPHFENDAIEVGTLWCDPYIAYQAQKAGLRIVNPCLSVKAFHLHLSHIRHNQGSSVPTKPYIFLPLCEL